MYDFSKKIFFLRSLCIANLWEHGGGPLQPTIYLWVKILVQITVVKISRVE